MRAREACYCVAQQQLEKLILVLIEQPFVAAAAAAADAAADVHRSHLFLWYTLK